LKKCFCRNHRQPLTPLIGLKLCRNIFLAIKIKPLKFKRKPIEEDSPVVSRTNYHKKLMLKFSPRLLFSLKNFRKFFLFFFEIFYWKNIFVETVAEPP